MKTLILKDTNFQLLEISFREWLEHLNYAKSTSEGYSIRVRELLCFLEMTEQQLSGKGIEEFVENLKQRRNLTLGGGLSNAYINYSIQSVYKFTHYLRLTKQIEINPSLNYEKKASKIPVILTQEEMESLFQIDSTHPIGKRKLAILSVLYGAGLRKSELQNLEREDVSFTKKTLHVTNGKGNKERLIPITDKIVYYIQDYIVNCRDLFEDTNHNIKEISAKLFIEIDGRAMSESALYTTIHEIMMEAEVQKAVTLHSFRHSIATHFMQQGMDIEAVAKFLGHNSLDSTMIYLHLANEYDDD